MMLWAGLTAGGQDRTPDRVGSTAAVARGSRAARARRGRRALAARRIVGPQHAVVRVDGRRHDCQPGSRTQHPRLLDAGRARTIQRHLPRIAASAPHENHSVWPGRTQTPPDDREGSDRSRRGRSGSEAGGGASLGHRDGRRPRPPTRIRHAVRGPVRSCCFSPTVNRPASMMPAFNGRWADGCSTGFAPGSTRKLGSDPGADETVRRWYLAVNGYMQATEQMEAWHVDRSVQLFPRDSEMLFFAACAREWFSGPQVQNTLQSTNLARDLFNLVGSEDDELGRAERLFRESLEREPRRNEARIRLGRILGRRGRHKEAIVELRRATMETKNRLLLYYGNMFLGAEADALGLGDEARKAYSRAAEPVSTRAVTAVGARHSGRKSWEPRRGAGGDSARTQSRRTTARGRSAGGATTPHRRATSRASSPRCTNKSGRSRGESRSRDRRRPGHRRCWARSSQRSRRESMPFVWTCS